jgi:PAS domain S-box-containing protein
MAMPVIRGKKKDGGWIYLDGFVTNLLDVKGIDGLVFNARDVTEKMWAEGELKESQKNLKALFDSVEDLFLIVDSEGNIIQTNRAVERRLGYSTEELTKMNILDVYPPDKKEEMKESLAEVKLGKKDTCNIPVIKKDGSIIPVETKITFGKWSGKDVTFGITRDITDRLQKEEELRESEEKFRNFFETSKDVIFLSTAEDGFFEINPAAEEFFGYTREELLEMDIMDIYADEKIREVGLKLMDERGSLQDMEVEFKRKDGAIVNGLITATLRKDKDCNVIGYQGIIRDITERKKIESQLISVQKMEAIGSLAGSMAHNFNNILVGIMGYSEYLSSKKSEDDPDYKALRIIYDASVKASELTKKLLSVARGGQYNPKRLNLNDIVNMVLPLLEGTFDKSVEIKTYLSDDLSTIRGDVAQMEQCLLSLCINARDSFPNGGKIIIETYDQKLDEDFVKTHVGAAEGDYVVISITDTGAGIPPEVREHIFEPFFTTKEDKGGTGMGLSMVYGIVNNHGGLITVDSMEGEGSTFSLYFPVLQ